MAGRFDVPKELREAGATVRKGGPEGDSVGIEWLAERCDQLERVVRMQYRDEEGGLPERYERGLRRPERTVTDLRSALKRWAYLKHVYLSWREGARPGRGGPGGESDEDQMRALVELLRAEPVTVRLTTGREVDLTDRSYSALREIGRHATRNSELEREIDRIADLVERIRGRLEDAEGGEEKRLYRRMQYLLELRQARVDEREEHRRAIVAHLTTEDGSPASSPDDAPEWADEVTPMDEVALITGVRQAMTERIDRLGERPDHPRDGDAEALEDWGTPAWLMPFRDFDDRTPIDAADPLDVRIGKAYALDRADSPLVYDTDREDAE